MLLRRHLIKVSAYLLTSRGRDFQVTGAESLALDLEAKSLASALKVVALTSYLIICVPSFSRHGAKKYHTKILQKAHF